MGAKTGQDCSKMSENGSRAALITVLAGGVLRAALQVAFPGAASWLGRSSIVLPVTAQPHRLSEAIFLAKQGLSPYATGDYAGDPVLPSALAFLHSALARVPVSLDLLGSVLLDVAVGVALMLIWGSIGDRRVEKSTSRLSRIGWSDSWAVGGALSWCLNPFSIAVAAAGGTGALPAALIGGAVFAGISGSLFAAAVCLATLGLVDVEALLFLAPPLLALVALRPGNIVLCGKNGKHPKTEPGGAADVRAAESSPTGPASIESSPCQEDGAPSEEGKSEEKNELQRDQKEDIDDRTARDAKLSAGGESASSVGSAGRASPGTESPGTSSPLMESILEAVAECETRVRWPRGSWQRQAVLAAVAGSAGGAAWRLQTWLQCESAGIRTGSCAWAPFRPLAALSMAPSLGVQWYMRSLMFPEARPLFHLVFASIGPLLSLAATIHLLHDPLLALIVSSLLLATLRSLPTYADLVIPVSFVLLAAAQGALLQGRLAGARHWQLGVNLWAMPALVAPFVWHSWAAMGWANANFLFAAGLVQMAGAGILLSEVLAPGRVERPGEDI